MAKKAKSAGGGHSGSGRSLRIRLYGATRQPLVDRTNVEVRLHQDDRLVRRWTDAPATQKFVADDLLNQQYRVTVSPFRHRRVQAFETPIGEAEDVTLYCPIDPKYAIPIFPTHTELPASLKAVLGRSTVASVGEKKGKALYDALKDRPKAGLLNLFAKMDSTFVAGKPSWSYVDTVYRIAGDRIQVNVKPGFRSLVEHEVSEGKFKEADDSLHKPDPGFMRAGSVKSKERYGNLQLSFFVSEQSSTMFTVDADIDNAAGFEHIFQVLENWLTDGKTDPYDIHQILRFHQRVDPRYALRITTKEDDV